MGETMAALSDDADRWRWRWRRGTDDDISGWMATMQFGSTTRGEVDRVSVAAGVNRARVAAHGERDGVCEAKAEIRNS
jgi:hypothetical protein